jgi:hypothetical protein
VLSSSAESALSRASLLEELADVQGSLRQHAAAAVGRKEALRLRLAASGGDTTVSALVMSYASIARDLQGAREYGEALGLLARARSAMKGAGGGSAGGASSGAVEGVLLGMESELHDCVGSPARALAAFEASLRARGAPPSPEDTLVLVDLLKKAAEAEAAAAPARGEALAARARALVAGLLAAGPWERAAQLPKVYERGLASAPWLEASGPAARWPHLTAPLAALLSAAAPALRAEFHALRARGAPHAETECIHTGGAHAGGGGGGAWTWFATNGFWTPADAHGCALDTPVACALLRNVSAAIPGLVVARGSYSAIERRAHLRPHHGWTNQRLKMHVGLEVPTRKRKGRKAATPCATLRVHNETRAWTEGGVLFFDDSFEHEVKHQCDALRVVFQVVFNHPDAMIKGEKGEGAAPAGAPAH